MRKNSLKRIFAALALSAVATTSVASISAFAAEETTTEPATEAETEAPTEAETEAPTEAETEAPTEAETEAGADASGGFTAEQIANSAVKPVLSASKITLKESEAKGKTVEVSISVSGAADNWCSSGVHLYFDERLKLNIKSNGRVDFTKGDAGADLNYEVKEEGSNGVFFATSASFDGGQDGTIVTYKFTLPDDAKAGDKYALDLAYVAGDLFRNSANDEAGQLMQAYVFTQGLSDGYIEVVADATPAPATTAAPVATTTAKATTTKAATTTGEKKDSPKTGVAGVGVAAAGLVVAAGAAFVLRKKED